MKTARNPSFLLGSLALTLGLALAACGGAEQPEIVGDWRSTDPVGNLGSNTLTVRASLKGEGDFKFYSNSTGYHANFSATCDASGADYACDMVCVGGCTDLNFTMTCEMLTADHMKCTGNGAWSGYGFEWSRVK